mmetsp:Transcript_14814/g.42703  ORF Transcript_14814/g.42703 Transcript_14814/m.42703 type:complete len:210 (-) Transcript_14814:119-748(-)
MVAALPRGWHSRGGGDRHGGAVARNSGRRLVIGGARSRADALLRPPRARRGPSARRCQSKALVWRRGSAAAARQRHRVHDEVGELQRGVCRSRRALAAGGASAGEGRRGGSAAAALASVAVAGWRGCMFPRARLERRRYAEPRCYRSGRDCIGGVRAEPRCSIPGRLPSCGLGFRRVALVRQPLTRARARCGLEVVCHRRLLARRRAWK